MLAEKAHFMHKMYKGMPKYLLLFSDSIVSYLMVSKKFCLESTFAFACFPVYIGSLVYRPT